MYNTRYIVHNISVQCAMYIVLNTNDSEKWKQFKCPSIVLALHTLFLVISRAFSRSISRFIERSRQFSRCFYFLVRYRTA